MHEQYRNEQKECKVKGSKNVKDIRTLLAFQGKPSQFFVGPTAVASAGCERLGANAFDSAVFTATLKCTPCCWRLRSCSNLAITFGATDDTAASDACCCCCYCCCANRDTRWALLRRLVQLPLIVVLVGSFPPIALLFLYHSRKDGLVEEWSAVTGTLGNLAARHRPSAENLVVVDSKSDRLMARRGLCTGRQRQRR
jgi:hypothetical protein